MFASVMLSFLITGVLTALIWWAVAFYRRGKPALPYFVFFGGLLTFVLFIPSCIAVDWVAYHVRSGEYHYATAAEMDDGLTLPAGARDITWYRTDALQSYRFKVSKDELRRWFIDFKNKFRDRPGFHESAEVSDKENDLAKVDLDMTKSHFAHTGWSLPSDIREVGEAMFAENGAGIHLWYSPSEGVAYCYTNSW